MKELGLADIPRRRGEPPEDWAERARWAWDFGAWDRQQDERDRLEAAADAAEDEEAERGRIEFTADARRRREAGLAPVDLELTAERLRAERSRQ